MSKSNIVNIELYPFTSKPSPLYPHHDVELKVMLVYGVDLRRQGCITSIAFPIGWIALFVVSAASILFFIRVRARRQRNGFISSAFDIQIALFAGGNLRIEHKWERWFFGILLIGVFFLLSIVLNSPLYGCAISPEQSVTTFSGLAKLKTPIYIGTDLKREQQAIIDIIRYFPKKKRCKKMCLFRAKSYSNSFLSETKLTTTYITPELISFRIYL